MPDPVIVIDGVTVDAVPGSLSVQGSLGNQAAANIDVWSTSGAYRPVVGKDLEVWEGASLIWAGSIDEVEESSITEAQPTGRRYSVRGVSWEQYLQRRLCFDVADETPTRYSRNFIFTADAGTDVITTTASHGRSNGDKVKVRCHANGTLAGGLSNTIEYFVINVTATTMKLSLTSGGAAVNITSAGTLEQILVTYRAGEIVAALLTDAATSEPLGTTNIASGAVIDTIIWDTDTTVGEAIQQLADASTYAWWIGVDRELYFQPRTFEVAPFSIGDATGNYRNFSVRRTREDKVNAAIMRVDMDQIGYTEQTFAGDGSATTFALTYPVGQIVHIRVNDEEKEFGVWLAESDRAYYYELGDTTIRQDAAETVLSASDSLVVVYRRFGANSIYIDDSADIASTSTAEGNSGIYQAAFERPGLGAIQALAEGTAIVAARKANVAEISYETDQEVEPTCIDLRVGQLQTIANSYHNISSGTYLIREVGISDVYGQWLKFTVKAIDANRLTGAIDFWKALGGRGSAASSGGFVGGGTTGLGGGSTNLEITLAANTTIASPYTPNEGDLLTVFVIQGAGPYTISFDSDFDTNFGSNIPAKAGAVTAFTFRGRSDGKWWAVSAPYSVNYE